MKKLEEMSIVELTAEHNARTGKKVKKVKGTKAQLIAKIEALPVAEVTVKPAATKSVRGPSTKVVLRGLFKNKSVAFTMAELVKKFPAVKPNTIETALVDLKNPKYAGGAVLVIKRGEDDKYRIAQ